MSETAPGAAAPAVPAVPIHWHRRVLTLAFPIVLANLTQPILGAVDTAVAGHLDGASYLGGVALGGLFFNFVFWGFGFLRMGTTGLVAQAHGAGDQAELRNNVLCALSLAAAIGARDRHAFRQAVKVTALWSALGAVGFSLTYWGAGAWIVERLTDQVAVRATAETYLPWAALSPVISVWGFLLDGVFIGATRTRELMMSMVVSFAVFVAASWALLTLYGNHGLWAAMLIFMAARGATLARFLPGVVRALPRVPRVPI